MMKSWLYYNGDYIAQILICTAALAFFSGVIWAVILYGLYNTSWNGFFCCVCLYICYRNTTLSDRIIINCIGVYINE